MRLLRTSPSWSVRICQDTIPTAWPTAQPILPNNFFLMSTWNFPSCCTCVFSFVLSLGRAYLDLLCYCLSGRVQQFSATFSFPSPTWTNSLTSLSSCISRSAPSSLRGPLWSFSSLAGSLSYWWPQCGARCAGVGADGKSPPTEGW